MDASDSDASDGAPPTSSPRREPEAAATAPVRKRRRPRATYHVRKDEIQRLQQRTEELELELKALRFQTLVAAEDASAAETTPPAAETPTIAKSRMTQQLLKDTVRSQQFTLAGLQALLSTYSSLQDTSPLHLGIRLSRDFDERRATLAAARASTLERARRFIGERSAGLDPLRAFAEQERFEDLHGAYCVTNFDVLPLPTSATSAFGVKSAHDMFCYLVRNVEITFSEWVGHITIRENEESPDVQCSQHRLVASCAALSSALVETNVVTFTDWQNDPEVGILVVDSVAVDELYPYKPEERVRRDTSGVFLFQKHGATPVITRWSLSKTYPSDLLESNEEMIALRSSLGLWGEKLLEALYGMARRAAASTPPDAADATDAADAADAAVASPSSVYNLSL